MNYLSTTCHVYFGSVTGATPDGRKAWEAHSDGISPVQGADRHGPTAVIQSAARMDHARTGGTLLNQKFTPNWYVEGEEGIDRLAHLVRSYFKLDGHHIQFNVVTADTLRAAQAEPGKYRDLIVRVAGYSDYFCDLTVALQNEIIARTEQTAFGACCGNGFSLIGWHQAFDAAVACRASSRNVAATPVDCAPRCAVPNLAASLRTSPAGRVHSATACRYARVPWQSAMEQSGARLPPSARRLHVDLVIRRMNGMCSANTVAHRTPPAGETAPRSSRSVTRSRRNLRDALRVRQ